MGLQVDTCIIQPVCVVVYVCVWEVRDTLHETNTYMG